MNWSDSTWKEAEPIYASIIEMPFIRELGNGTLALERFKFYMAQDSGYLEHFGRALATIAARSPNIKDALEFIRFAEGAIVVENALHASYFKTYGIMPDEIVLQPACHHYVHYLRSTATMDPIAVAMAAVLPCFWIYKKVGDHILSVQDAIDNPYKDWIDTYAGEEFGKSVARAIAICDRIAEMETVKCRRDMTRAFITSSRLEFQFWDAAYNRRKW
ncbi:MAG: thiaminase II [Sediminicola sp.]